MFLLYTHYLVFVNWYIIILCNIINCFIHFFFLLNFIYDLEMQVILYVVGVCFKMLRTEVIDYFYIEIIMENFVFEYLDKIQYNC